MWERRLVTSCSVFGRIDDWGMQEANHLRHTYCGQSFFSPIRLVKNKRYAVEGGSRLRELKR